MEDTKPVSIKNWKHCPFRGLPKIQIDDRCPTHLQALPLGVDTGYQEVVLEPAKRGRPRKDEVREQPPASEEIVMLIPVLEEESYCDTCITGKIRELEEGLISEVRLRAGSNFRPEKKRGRPRKS